jgi:hypothetical protein
MALLAPERDSCQADIRESIDKVSMEETRWGAGCPGNAPTGAQDSWQVLIFEGKSG